QGWLGGIRVSSSKNTNLEDLVSGIILKNNEIKNNTKVGIYLKRVRNSVIENVVLDNNKLHVYVDYDSWGNVIRNNLMEHTHTREALAIDAAFDNRIENNIIRNNKVHGITLYHNCGEAGTYVRRFGADRNYIS